MVNAKSTSSLKFEHAGTSGYEGYDYECLGLQNEIKVC